MTTCSESTTLPQPLPLNLTPAQTPTHLVPKVCFSSIYLPLFYPHCTLFKHMAEQNKQSFVCICTRVFISVFVTNNWSKT